MSGDDSPIDGDDWDVVTVLAFQIGIAGDVDLTKLERVGAGDTRHDSLSVLTKMAPGSGIERDASKWRCS